MAKFEIEQPDGSKYEIEAPDGFTDAQVMEVINQQIGGVSSDTPSPQGGETREPLTWGETINNSGRLLLQGATLGFGDEITAGVRSLVPEALGGATYDEALADERGGIKAFREENPATALGLEVAGGFAVPGVGAARGVKAAPSLGQKITTGAKYGGAYGTAGGFGVGEGGFGERLKSARTGLQWGLGLGVALPTVGAGVGKVVKTANNTFSRAAQAVRDDEAAARQYIADKWHAAGIHPNDVAADLADGQQARLFPGNQVASLPEAIADTSRTSQRLLRGIKVGGDADDIIEPALINRQAGQMDFAPSAQPGGQFARVYDQTRKALGVTSGSLRDDVDRLKSNRKIEGDANFRAAVRNSQPFDLDDTLTRYDLEAFNMPDPKQRNIMVGAIRLFRKRPDIPENYAGHRGPEAAHREARAGVQDIAAFQKAKFALDDLLDKNEIREQSHLYSQLTGLKNDLVDVVAGGSRLMPQKNQQYIHALDTHRSYSELINAANYGKAVAKGEQELSTHSWSELAPAEKEIARKAWVSTHKLLAGSKKQGRTADYANFYQKPNIREQIQIMMPPNGVIQGNAYPRGRGLTRLANGEVRMSETTAINLGGSPTADKAADVAGLQGIATYLQRSGGPVNAVIMKFAEKLEEIGAVRGRRARYLAKKLLTVDPAEQADFLRQIKRTMSTSRAKKIDDAIEVFTVEYSRNIAGVGARTAAQPEYQQ